LYNLPYIKEFLRLELLVGTVKWAIGWNREEGIGKREEY
jgi:hypothetical protein